MRNKIKYFCYYDNADLGVTYRSFCLAATNKIDYISKALNSRSISVELVSLSGGKNRSFFFDYLPGSITEVNAFTTLRLFPTVTSKNIIIRVFGRQITKIFFFYYVLTQCKKGETILAYHSLGYSRVFCFLKKIKNFKLVLEIEEIYSDVTGNAYDRKKEDKFFNISDAYIFPTEFLEEKINLKKKPFVIIHGTYDVEENRDCAFGDDLIHIVYAGTLDPRKGGASAAIASAMYLDNSFHIHVLGFGTKENIYDIMSQIKFSQDNSTCSITFDGLLSGEEYIRFIQACDIGLSTQNPNATFNISSFPSKVLSYMANGLKVVSARIQVVEQSAVGDLITYYDKQSPQSIANAIRTACLIKEYDSRIRVKELDMLFQQNIKELIVSIDENHK